MTYTAESSLSKTPDKDVAMQPHDLWQTIYQPGSFDPGGPHETVYPATLRDGRQLLLPIRPLADGRHALASLIINQASFTVQDALAGQLADLLVPFAPDIVVGLPTLGLTLAGAAARMLGHSRYVPLGTSRKFWYRDDLSEPMSSITTPGVEKRLYLDPRMLALLEGKRVALVDDVISSGTSIRAGLSLLARVNVKPVAVGAAMLQSRRRDVALADAAEDIQARTLGVFSTPLLSRTEKGDWCDASEL